MRSILPLVVTLALSSPLAAQAFDRIAPADHASLGPWPGGDVAFDTDALTFGGVPGGVRARHRGRDVALFVFDGATHIPAGTHTTVRGSLPLALGFQGEVIVSGAIDASGQDGFDAIPEGPATAGGLGGPGGHDGGSGGGACVIDATVGLGPGGGQPGPSSANPAHGGGGGGFGAPGTKGGSLVAGQGGPAYGDLLVLVEGGSGGGGGGVNCSLDNNPGGGGGGGGGVVQLIATTTVSILGGSIDVTGGDGGSAGSGGGGGGGSGGAIHVEAFNVEIEPGSVLDARGGAGGAGANNGGGAGGGGRIVVVTNTFGRFCDRTLNTILVDAGEYAQVDDPTVGEARPVPSMMPLDPDDFASLGAFPVGDVHFDTDALTVNGAPGGVLHDQGPCTPRIAVFTFDGGATLAAGSTISASGGRPLAVLVHGDFTVAGTVLASGADGGEGGTVPGPGGAGALGGFDGGTAVTFGSPAGQGLGFGPGAGGPGTSSASGGGTSPGSGGGFGGDGGGPQAGAVYGELLRQLEGGSGGGAGGSVVSFFLSGGGGGGAGGGALHLGASGRLELTGAAVRADGGDGATGQRSGAGGSGGAIVLAGDEVSLDAATSVSARGGTTVGGNGGGGGRVIVATPDGGLTDAAGGADVAAGPNGQPGVYLPLTCQRDAGLGTGALLSLCGDPLVPGGSARLTLETPVPFGLAFLWASATFATTDFLGETILLPNFGLLKLKVFVTNVAGAVELPGVSGVGVPVDLFLQMSVADDEAPSGYTISNVVQAEFH